MDSYYKDRLGDPVFAAWIIGGCVLMLIVIVSITVTYCK
jgi:hypothetical protein